MPKYKVNASDIIRFDYKGKEKALEPGHSYELDLEGNDFLQGLEANGVLEVKQDVAPVEEVKPKNR